MIRVLVVRRHLSGIWSIDSADGQVNNYTANGTLMPNHPFLAQESQIHTYKQVQAIRVDLCQLFIHIVPELFICRIVRVDTDPKFDYIFYEYSIHAHFNELSYQNIFCKDILFDFRCLLSLCTIYETISILYES